MLIDFDEAKWILGPHIHLLSQAMRKGFGRFAKLEPKDKIDFRTTTQAGIVHDFQVKEVERASVDIEEINVVRFGELSILLIENTFAVKIKKFNKHLKSSSQLTKQVKDFLNQDWSLPGIPDLTNLELGYTLNALGDIEDILIVCPKGQYDNYWEWGLDSGNENVIELLRFQQTDEEKQQTPNRYSTDTGEESKDGQIGGNEERDDQ